MQELVTKTQTTAETKTCKKCGVAKPLSEFYVVNGRWYLRTCKVCTLERMGKYHQRTWLERYTRYQQVRKERTRRFYRDTLKPRNLALYGKATSPKDAERARQARRDNKRQTGYVKTEKQRIQEREHFLLLRTKVITLYGGKCECCGESRFKMLTIDHKIKTYYRDKVHGVALVYDALHEHGKSGYPNDKYRLLCWNCNISNGKFGYCPHRQCYQEYEYRDKATKLEMIAGYGGRCVLCGDDHWEFLTIDHINGGGTRHCKVVGSGAKLYRWLKQRKWPRDKYRLLCANCNCSDKRNGWSNGEVPKLGRV